MNNKVPLKYFKKYNKIKKEYFLMKSNNFMKLKFNIINGFIINNNLFENKLTLDDELKKKINNYFYNRFIKDFDKFLEKMVDKDKLIKIKPDFKYKIINNKNILINGFILIFINNKKREDLNLCSRFGFFEIDNEHSFVFPFLEL